MPRISEFHGLVIYMYHGDHPAPHFHVEAAGAAAKIEIASGALMAGRLPARALALARERAALHRQELFANWRSAERMEPLNAIAPLP